MLNDTNYIMLSLSIVIIVILFFCYIIERFYCKKDIFSAGSFFIYFSLLPAFSNLYFSLNQEAFYNNVLIMVASEYKDYFYVYAALFLQVVAIFSTYIGLLMSYQKNDKLASLILKKLFRYDALDKASFNFRNDGLILFVGVVVLALGVVVYIKFISAIGGLAYLWLNMHERAVTNAGLGYYQTFFMFAVPLGSFMMIYVLLKKDKKTLSFLVIAGVVLLLGSLGSRGPALSYIISLLIFYHYHFHKIKSLFNFKLVLIYLSFPMIIVIMLQFRGGAGSSVNTDTLISNSVKSLERGFIARVGRLERDIVIIKYFTEHNFWLGSSYLGLITAPIPRTLYPEKPPNDSGMYLRTIADGHVVVPPVAVNKLLNSSWPEQNWVGYMNWGIIGFIFTFFLSGYITGKIYSIMVERNCSVIGAFLYAKLIIGGVIVLSPLPLINLLMYAIILNVFYFLIIIPTVHFVKRLKHSL